LPASGRTRGASVAPPRCGGMPAAASGLSQTPGRKPSAINGLKVAMTCRGRPRYDSRPETPGMPVPTMLRIAVIVLFAGTFGALLGGGVTDHFFHDDVALLAANDA